MYCSAVGGLEDQQSQVGAALSFAGLAGAHPACVRAGGARCMYAHRRAGCGRTRGSGVYVLIYRPDAAGGVHPMIASASVRALSQRKVVGGRLHVSSAAGNTHA